MTINTSINSKPLPAVKRNDADRTGNHASDSGALPFQNLLNDRPRPAPNSSRPRHTGPDSAPDQATQDTTATSNSNASAPEPTRQRENNQATDTSRDGKQDGVSKPDDSDVKKPSQEDQATPHVNAGATGHATPLTARLTTDASAVDAAASAADEKQPDVASDVVANAPGLELAADDQTAGDADTSSSTDTSSTNNGNQVAGSADRPNIADVDGLDRTPGPDATSNSKLARQKGSDVEIEGSKSPASKQMKKRHVTKRRSERHPQNLQNLDTLQNNDADQANSPATTSKHVGPTAPSVPADVPAGTPAKATNASSSPAAPPNTTNTEHAADTKGRTAVSERLFNHRGSGPNNPERLTPADRIRLVNRVAKAIHSAPDQNGVLRIRLRPAELGSLRLEVSVQNGHLSARLETETAAARHVILDSLPQLRDRLADQGMRIDQFHVDIGGGNPDHAGHQTHGRQSPGPAKHGSAKTLEPIATRDAAEQRTAHPVLAPGQLNVIV